MNYLHFCPKKTALIKTAIILFILVVVGCDQSTKPPGVEPVDLYVNINGTVMDASYAKPVADAVVRFSRSDGAYSVERQTNAEGEFDSLIGYVDSCETISEFRVEVIKEGYVSTTLIGGIDFNCITEAQTFIVDLHRTEDYNKEYQVVVYGTTRDGISLEPIGGVQIQIFMYYEGKQECETSPLVITTSSTDSLRLGTFRLTYTWEKCTRDFYMICNKTGYDQTTINYGLIGTQRGELYTDPFVYPIEAQ